MLENQFSNICGTLSSVSPARSGVRVIERALIVMCCQQELRQQGWSGKDSLAHMYMLSEYPVFIRSFFKH